MKIFRAKQGIYIESDNKHYRMNGVRWDDLIAQENLEGYLAQCVESAQVVNDFHSADILPPIGGQEVWAAGVTYFRSRDARMEESKSAGGGSFYDRVYTAERPELFFKATASRVVGTDQPVRIRKDAAWSVPEPELTLVISPGGKIVGYTVGNDMSSRDIEGENPLYLPQAKVYDGSCAIGPGILVSSRPLEKSTAIQIEIARDKKVEFSGATTLAELKRDPQVLVSYLYRECSFPFGSLLMTGTGIIPPDTFTLKPGDEIRISIDGIGTLTNFVEMRA